MKSARNSICALVAFSLSVLSFSACTQKHKYAYPVYSQAEHDQDLAEFEQATALMNEALYNKKTPSRDRRSVAERYIRASETILRKYEKKYQIQGKPQAASYIHNAYEIKQRLGDIQNYVSKLRAI